MHEVKEEKLLTELEITKHNIQRVKLLCKVFTIIIVFALVMTTIFSNLTYFQINEHLSQQLFHHISMLVVNIVMFGFLYFRKIKVSKHSYKKMNKVIGLYVALMTAISAFHSFQQEQNYNQLMMYTLILLICCSFLVLSKAQLMFSLILSSTLLIWGLFHQADQAQLNSQLVYLFSLLPISYFISRSLFRSFQQSAIFQIELMKEVQMNRELTKTIRETNRQLQLQSSLDPLTNLSNRRAFNQYIEQLKQRKTPYRLTILMVDIDFFKSYNDEYGHLEGDQVLIKIGDVLKIISEECELFVARWGGEEFAIVLLNKQANVAEYICERVCQDIRNLNITHRTSSVAPVVTVSVGASTKEIYTNEDIRQCLQRADELLYRVKETGRNGYIHEESELNKQKIATV